MSVFNLIALLGALVLAFGGWAGRGWVDSHHGLHITRAEIHAPFRWAIPDSWKGAGYTTPADERDQALAALAAEKTLVQALKAQGAVRLAKAEALPQAARAGAALGLSKRREISAVAPDDDECKFFHKVDGVFKETLK